MRARADRSQTRPTSRVRRTVALSVGLLLVATLVPAVPAGADNHRPWDQPGSAWQGTIETDTSFTTEDQNGKSVVSHKASYTEISPLQDTADGDYGAEVVAGGSEDIWGACYGKEGVANHLWNYRWQLDTRVEDPLTSPGKFGLTTTDEGRTFFALWYQGLIPFEWTSYCTGDGEPIEGANPKESGFTKLGFLDGSTQGYSSQPLPDLDPDPLHLVGSRTWTLGDPPVAGMLPDNMTRYSLTATYDLRLVDSCTNSNVTHDTYRADLDAADILEFELRTIWCTGPGELRVMDTEVRGETLQSPWDAAVESVIREVTTYHNTWTTSVDKSGGPDLTVVTGDGRWKDCWGIPMPLKAERLDVLASLFRKVAKRIDNDAARYVVYKFADALEKAANKLDSATRWVVRQIIEAGIKLINKLPDGVQRRITKLILYVVADDYTSQQWARDYVRQMPSEKLISKILDDELSCRTVWKPRIVHRLNPDNTSTSEFVDLDGDSEAWNFRRTGGSS